MATKTYNAVSPQIAVLQTSTKTFSINSNLKPAEVNHFAELVHGTIRFNLQDFSNGKGDKSIFVYYNMEIFEVYDLMDHVKWQQKFSAQKIHGKYPEKEGKFAGMCKTFHFYMQFQPTMPNGQTSKNPYVLTIENGYATAGQGTVPGSFYEQRNSFQKTGSVTLRMSYSQFYNQILRPIIRYIDSFTSYCAESLIPNGLARLEEQERAKDYRNQPYNYAEQQNAVPNQQQTTNSAQQYSPVPGLPDKKDTLPGQIHSCQCIIVSPPVALNDVYVGRVKLGNQEYVCIFDCLDNRFQEAYRANAVIALDLQNLNHKLHCVGVSA